MYMIYNRSYPMDTPHHQYFQVLVICRPRKGPERGLWSEGIAWLLPWGGGSKTKEISMKNIGVKVVITNQII